MALFPSKLLLFFLRESKDHRSTAPAAAHTLVTGLYQVTKSWDASPQMCLQKRILVYSHDHYGAGLQLEYDFLLQYFQLANVLASSGVEDLR